MTISIEHVSKYVGERLLSGVHFRFSYVERTQHSRAVGVGKLLGWDHSAPTMVSILAKECDAPWAVNPFGYCTDKYEFDKICLPDLTTKYLVAVNRTDISDWRRASPSRGRSACRPRLPAC